MSGTPSKVYLTRAGGSGEDELYALVRRDLSLPAM